MSSNSKGIIFGVYNLKSSANNEDKKATEVKLTKFAESFNEKCNGKLMELINNSFCENLSCGSTRILYNAIDDYKVLIISSLGDPSKWDPLDEINGVKENVRIASSSAIKALQSLNISEVHVDDFDGQASSSAEGTILGSFKFQACKEASKRSKVPIICPVSEANMDDWTKGEIFANSQNFCRILMDMPANLMTPTIFAETVKEKYAGLANLEIKIHDEEWARKENMNLFLSVSAGSSEPAKFLEITYSGGDAQDAPIAFVGKGITFDSGGISIKPSSKMDQMRGDLGGASNVASCLLALAQLKAKVNVKGFIPLCENMPGNFATKPGDVIYGRNGKSVAVDNTDAEGRLVLADALSYASDFKPKFILDVATLTGAVRVALGDCCTAIYSNNDSLWESIHEAGRQTGDRMWRMPLFTHYSNQMTEHDAYDLNNLGKGKGGGSCTAAAFLREFVPKGTSWMHADIAGVMCDTSDQSYIGGQMSGRPLRTFTEFIINQSKQ